MIRLLYTEIASLPEPGKLAKEIPEPFLRAYYASHKKPISAGLGGLWLAASGGASGELFYDEKGRPNLSDKQVCDLSISHTKNFIFCALASGEHHRVGLDAEDGARLDEATMEKIVRRFFVQKEIAEFEAAARKKEAFLAIWTKKEAYAKYTGEGLAALLAGKVLEKPCCFMGMTLSGTVLSICADRPFENGFLTPEKVEFRPKNR
ncbi:MAG: 4'-phosphopantetheinyl transferase superfamily protein [Clostridia bacterium]|nr:4'-phosphopantetheinyl transferase superfamily protein [Clostridia bacterium]